MNERQLARIERMVRLETTLEGVIQLIEGLGDLDLDDRYGPALSVILSAARENLAAEPTLTFLS